MRGAVGVEGRVRGEVVGGEERQSSVRCHASMKHITVCGQRPSYLTKGWAMFVYALLLATQEVTWLALSPLNTLSLVPLT